MKQGNRGDNKGLVHQFHNMEGVVRCLESMILWK